MKFKVDENLPVELADLLITAGHDALSVFAEGLQGQDDSAVASACVGEERVLISLDLDFVNILQYPPHQYPGLIVLRLSRRDKPHVLHVFAQIIPLIDQEELAHRLWIVEETRLRIRGAE